jgi:curved DNA-binding protein CbpA
METLYDLLGARSDDDAERLKSAYRSAAKANHPDRHAGDPDAVVRFTRIARAYEILRDPERRAAYDRLLELRRKQLRSKARRVTSRPAYRFAFKAIAAVVVGIILAVGARVYGIAGGDIGGMMAGQRPRMVAVEPAKQADTAKGAAPSPRLARAPQMPVMLGAATSAVKGESAWEAAQRPSASDAAVTTGFAHSVDPIGSKAVTGDPDSDHRVESPERPRPTEQKTAAMSRDEICKRDAVRLAQLRISQEHDEVVRFERGLGCEKLRPQVIRLRESVDPQ